MTRDSQSPATPKTEFVEAGAADNLDYFAAYTAASQLRALAVGDAIAAAIRGLRRLYAAAVTAPAARRRARDSAYRELMSLDDHMLKDIGITKGDIPYVVQGAELGLGVPYGATHDVYVNENTPRRAA